MRKTISISVLILTIIASVTYIYSNKNNTPQINTPTNTTKLQEKISTSTALKSMEDSATTSDIGDNSCNNYDDMDLPEDYDQFKEVDPQFSNTYRKNALELPTDGMCGNSDCGRSEEYKFLSKIFPSGVPDNIDSIYSSGEAGKYNYSSGETGEYKLYRINTNTGNANGDLTFSMIVNMKDYSFKIYRAPDNRNWRVDKSHTQKPDGYVKIKGNYYYKDPKFSLYTHRDRIYYYKEGDKTFHLIGSSMLKPPEVYFSVGYSSYEENLGDIYSFKIFNCNKWKSLTRTLTLDLNAIDEAQAAASSTYR